MSQQNKRPPSAGGSQRPSGQQPKSQPPRKSGSPPPVRRGAAPQKSSFMVTVDRILPPFSVQRYAVIWILVMVPLALALLLLLRPSSGSNSAASQATPTTAAAALPTPTTAAVTNNQQPPAAPTPAAYTGAGFSLTGPGKYMVFETAKGRIVAKLHTEPEANVSGTIANFEKKANDKYFDGLNFHRVEDWVIQGGDPSGNGSGGGSMQAEYNMIPFKTGALGVARAGDPAVNNDSQFFIVKADADSLNGQYTNFGQVTEGMDIANKIAIGDKITSIRVEDRK